MRAKIIAVAVLLVVSLTGLGASPSSATSAGAGSITGRVVGADGDLRGQVKVTAYHLSSTGSWYAADANMREGGAYVIDELAPGRYRVQLSVPRQPIYPFGPEDPWSDVAPQWFPGTGNFADAQEVVVQADAKTELGTTVLPRGGHVTGRIVNGAGDPLPGRSRLEALTLGPYGWQTETYIDAADDGSFDLAQLSSADYVLRATGSSVSGEGYDAAAPYAVTYSGDVADIAGATHVSVPAGATVGDVTIHSISNGRLQGLVLGPEGRPLPEIEVTVQGQWSGPDRTRTTDAAGRWDFGQLRADDWAVELRDPAGTYDYTELGNAAFLDVPGRITVRNTETSDVTTVMPWAPPRAVIPPTLGWVSDTRVPIGTLLTVDPGTWDPASTTTVRWFRGEGPAIANGPSYRLTAADRGTDLHATITPKAARPSRTEATYVGRVIPSDLPGAEFDPNGLDNPTIDDTSPEVGQTIRAVPAVPGASGWRWYRNGDPVAGATGDTYTVQEADRSARLTVVATQRDRQGRPEGFAVSAPTSPVGPTLPPSAGPVPRPVPSSRLSMSVKPLGSRKVRVTLRVRSTTAAADIFDGLITISRVRSGPDALTTRRMKDGKLTLVLRRQPKGKRAFYATLRPQPDRFQGAFVRRTVRVR